MRTEKEARTTRSLTASKKQTIEKLAKVVDSDPSGLQGRYMLGVIEKMAESSK